MKVKTRETRQSKKLGEFFDSQIFQQWPMQVVEQASDRNCSSGSPKLIGEAADDGSSFSKNRDLHVAADLGHALKKVPAEEGAGGYRIAPIRSCSKPHEARRCMPTRDLLGIAWAKVSMAEDIPVSRIDRVVTRRLH